MATVLDKIVATKRDELTAAKTRRPLSELRAAVADAPPIRDFVASIREYGPQSGTSSIAVIAEVKKASPSAGVIREDFDHVAIAKEYDAAGAACVSVLTDEQYFQGALQYLIDVRAAITKPVIRKDFLIDPYQVYEARAAGADCVLLIAECLEQDRLVELFETAGELGMHCLIELYDEANVERVLSIEPPLVGVNNRDLRTFTVDINHSARLRKQMPDDVVFVSESGIRGGDETRQLVAGGISAVLVGETLMRAESIETKLRELALTDS